MNIKPTAEAMGYEIFRRKSHGECITASADFTHEMGYDDVPPLKPWKIPLE